MKKLTVCFAAVLFFLLPLKFGGLAVMPESGGFYPEFWSDWFFITWPPHAIGFFGGLLLIMALISYRENLSKKQWIQTLSWSLLPSLAVLPGSIRGDGIIALGECSLLLGCGSVIAAAAVIMAKEPDKGRIFAAAILFGGVCAAFYGWYQHLYTLDEMRAFVAEQEAKGIPVSEAMRLKLTDPRIYSTLASSNAFASLLMILAVLGFYFSGEWSKKVSPPEQTKIVLRVFFGLLFISALFLTRSRSMVFCPVAAGLLALFSTDKIKWKIRLAGLIGGAVLLAAGIAVGIAVGRGAASMGERVDYLRTSAILCADYPFAGSGWGGFFRNHMQMKLSDVDESARDPHNVVAKFASQCGIPAGLVIFWVLICPLIMLWKYRFSGTFSGAVFWCGVIFTLHSLIDCDWQVPALIAIMGVLYAAAIARLPEDGKGGCRYLFVSIASLIIAAGAWISSYWYLAGDRALSRLQDKVNPATPEMMSEMAPYPVELLAQEVEKYRPGQAVIPMYCGDYYTKQGNLDEAEKYYLNALEREPVRPAAYARLARLALLRGDREKAEKLIDQAHRLFPKGKNYNMKKLEEDVQL